MIKQAVFEAAFEKIGPATHPAQSTVAVAASVGATLAHGRPQTASAGGDPKRFLLQVMNDDNVPLALRIEAAKALLQHSNELRPRHGD